MGDSPPPFSWLGAWLQRKRGDRLAILNVPHAPKPSPPLVLNSAPIFPQEPISSRFEASPDFRSSGNAARKIDLVVLHCTESSAAGALAWLTAKDAMPVSAHYLISKAGDLVQMVGENNVSYHAGGTKEKPSSWRGAGKVNERSVGIELENRNDGLDPYPPAQLTVCLWLVLRACRRFGLTAEEVVGHADVDPGRKSDPRGFPWEPFRSSLAFHLSRPGGIA